MCLMDSVVDWRFREQNPCTWGHINRIYSVWTTEKSRLKKWQLLRDFWDSNKRSNVYTIRILDSEKECEAEQLFKEIMNEIFPSLSKDINLQI